MNRRFVVWMAAGLASLGVGCDGCGGSGGLGTFTGGGSGGDFDSDRRPYRDEWRLEAEIDFPTEEIVELVVGGTRFNDNFGNNGDIIVRFDGPPDLMTVELRRFTTTTSQALAELDYADLHLWAYSGALAHPESKTAEEDCVLQGWSSSCALRVHYDGLSQLVRSGADIRVTLPPDFRNRLSLTTEDNTAGTGYHNRGDVCIEGLNASADIELGSGRVFVAMDPAITPAPRCTAEQVAACENWTTTNEQGQTVPAPWDLQCDCLVQLDGAFGNLTVDGRDANSTEITIDMPADLWSSIRVGNDGQGQSRDGVHCDAAVEVPGWEEADIGNEFPWEARGFTNYPGEPATTGAGYSVLATSAACGPVSHTNSPEEFVGEDGEQEVFDRGNIQICSGCIALGCDDLLDD
ncbi:MAG: hypothetical protein AAF799_20790 [Myxococcota bacterium]